MASELRLERPPLASSHHLRTRAKPVSSGDIQFDTQLDEGGHIIVMPRAKQNSG